MAETPSKIQKLHALQQETVALRQRLLDIFDEGTGEDRELLHGSEHLKQAIGFMDQVIQK